MYKRAHWLITLRWIAIVCVVFGTYICNSMLAIELQATALYSIAILLAAYNVVMLLLLNRFNKGEKEVTCREVKKIINFQISADLLLLTALLHFSGGIENPFVFYFTFHMIIASILLSLRESYLQATFAVLLFGLLVLFEYMQIIPHYCLRGFVSHCLHRDGPYLVGTFFVFATALYLAVYMTSYIAVRLRRAEQAYKQANLMLEEKDRIKDEYVLRVTHDIKGHLATIQSCLSVIVNGILGPLDEQQTDLISRAHKRTITLTNFVKKLLELTQMRLSNKLEMESFSLNNTVDSVVETVKTKAEDKSITLKSNVEPSADRIFGNQFSIEEMLTNLLLNSIKYTPESGTVEINATSNGEGILVEVADTGIGIPEEEQKQIFDEFYRASNARNIERDGTGLGLSIVKHIINRHGGKIEVESKNGCGTKFRLTLLKEKGSQHGLISSKTESLTSG
ncbi:MAG: HAMP domain-containing histidine kinase [Phycisphaerae bacterium]|nr:HAMP domain-containing histidine kinase [Phycisphaerae bacterium]